MPALPTSIGRRELPRAPWRPTPRIRRRARPPSAPRSISATAPSRARRQRCVGVGRMEIVLDPRPAAPQIAAEQRRPMGDRLVGRRRQLAPHGCGRLEADVRHRRTDVLSPEPLTPAPPASRAPRSARRRAIGLLVPRNHSATTPWPSAADGESAMSTMLTPAATQRQRDLGEHTRPVRHRHAELVDRPTRESRPQQRVAVRPGRGVPVDDRRAVGRGQSRANVLQAGDRVVDRVSRASRLER